MTDTTHPGTAVTPFHKFKTEIEVAGPSLKKLLPAHISIDKFQQVVLGAVTANPKLLEANRMSLFRACRDAAEIGLSLNGALKQADILVRKGMAQFQPRYGGLMELARRSGQIKTIYAHVVREGDTFEYELGTEKTLRHKPAGNGAMTHVYCVWVLRDGTKDFEVMTKAEVEGIKRRSPAAGNGPWVTDEAEMWRKTVVRRASKYWPASPEMDRAMGALNELDAEEATPVEGAVDVTDWETVDTSLASEPEPEAPAAPAPATSQVDAVAAKIGATPAPAAAPAPAPAAKKAPTKQRIINVPQKDDKPDWPAYAAAVQEFLSGAADPAKAWAAQAIVLANLKTARPDLYDALDSFRNTLGEE